MEAQQLSFDMTSRERKAANGNGAGWLVWFDNNPEHKLEDKITAACERFRAKHRREPVEVRVNSAVKGASGNGVKVVPDPLVTVHCFWVGMVPSREE